MDVDDPTTGGAALIGELDRIAGQADRLERLFPPGGAGPAAEVGEVVAALREAAGRLREGVLGLRLEAVAGRLEGLGAGGAEALPADVARELEAVERELGGAVP